ncbi:hypothetical protein BHYA_0040g00290 [Botrytis hyacinthi]|uniref:Uncharacterized protein n=1 Tax=Botrytis hyacinthi TaxID=278943 RepID=A0A4Z1GYG1_9HELO|nr:hypothetical protein BHYA_0040g00290 [Botrytis hyacinthi]
MDADMTTSFTSSSLPMVPGPETFYQIPPNFDPSRSPTSISEPQFQGPSPLPRKVTLSPEKERKSDRVMKGVIGLNFRPGVEIGNGDRNLTSVPSVKLTSTSGPKNSSSNHFYGFCWTCCNKIAEKATVLGSMRGAVESAVKGLFNTQQSTGQPCKSLRKKDLSALEDTSTKKSKLTLTTVFVVAMTIADVPIITLKAVAKANMAGEEDRLADMSKYLEHWGNVISLRKTVASSRDASLKRAEEEFERKKNELLAPKNWFEQIGEWSENTSKCAQDGSSYGSYENKPRSHSNGSLQPTRALDSGKIPRRRRSFHGDRPT